MMPAIGRLWRANPRVPGEKLLRGPTPTSCETCASVGCRSLCRTNVSAAHAGRSCWGPKCEFSISGPVLAPTFPGLFGHRCVRFDAMLNQIAKDRRFVQVANSASRSCFVVRPFDERQGTHDSSAVAATPCLLARRHKVTPRFTLTTDSHRIPRASKRDTEENSTARPSRSDLPTPVRCVSAPTNSASLAPAN